LAGKASVPRHASDAAGWRAPPSGIISSGAATLAPPPGALHSKETACNRGSDDAEFTPGVADLVLVTMLIASLKTHALPFDQEGVNQLVLISD
jgi:hypothetical protein